MGQGIAEVCARAGLPVILCDVDEDNAIKGLAGIGRSLARTPEGGKTTAQDREHAWSLITATADLSRVAKADLVIEAITENETAKATLFRQLDELITGPDTVLATNTSAIPISRLAGVTRRPEAVIGLHFFNPVPRMPLVEIIPGVRTSKATEQRVTAFAGETLGKQPISASDRAGFVVNSLLVPYLLAAVRMVGAGVATPEDVDRGMTAGCGHPMGRCGWRTSSAWTPWWRLPGHCTKNTGNRSTPLRRCCAEWLSRECWGRKAGKASTIIRRNELVNDDGPNSRTGRQPARRFAQPSARRSGDHARPIGVGVEIFEGLTELPFYNEDLDPVPAAEVLRTEVRAADAALLVSPEYNGTMPHGGVRAHGSGRRDC